MSERVEGFLEACVKWERAWEILVHTGLIYDIKDSAEIEHRLAGATFKLPLLG